MYYEEKIINGVLHWRGHRSAGWTPKTPEQLTTMLIEARNQKQQNGTYEPIPYWMNPCFKLPPATS